MSKRSIKRLSFSCCLSATLLICAAIVPAQEFRGTITGTVADQNGAAVAGANVTVKNTETNISNTVAANDQGSYTVRFLVPGTYTVSATYEGFKTSTIENVQVRVDDRLTVDVKLQVGTSAEVDVLANTDVIEQGSVTLGTLVSQRQIEELPLAEGAP